MELLQLKSNKAIKLQQRRGKAAPNPPVGGPQPTWGPTFYFTTTILKVGIFDQC